MLISKLFRFFYISRRKVWEKKLRAEGCLVCRFMSLSRFFMNKRWLTPDFQLTQLAAMTSYSNFTFFYTHTWHNLTWQIWSRCQWFEPISIYKILLVTRRRRLNSAGLEAYKGWIVQLNHESFMQFIRLPPSLPMITIFILILSITLLKRKKKSWKNISLPGPILGT